MKPLRKLTNYLKAPFTLLLLVSCFYSCSNDKNDIPENIQNTIKLTPAHISLYDEEGAISKTVQIEGEGDYSVVSEDEEIATASVKDKTVTIKMGTKSGATTVIVSNQQGARGEITVNSGIYDLKLDRYTLNMKPGEKAAIKVLSGNFIYAGEDLTVEAINEEGDNSKHFETDKNILWQDPKRTTMTIKALKAGKTTIKITDQKGKTAEIALEVLNIQLNNLSVSKSNMNIYGRGNDIVEVTNGNGEYDYALSAPDIVELTNIGTSEKPIFLLKAQQTGETELSITDKLTEQTQDIRITVKDYSNAAALLPANKWLAIDFKKYAELYPDKVNNWAQIPELTWEIEAKINAGSAATLLGIEGQFLARTPFSASNKYISMCIADHPNVYPEYELDKNLYYKFTFVVNFNNKTTDIYINGIKQAVKTDGSNDYSRGGLDLTSPDGHEENLFAIGRACGGRYLNGGVKYVRMWTRCLTDKEVKDYSGKLYVDPSSPYLLGEWVFEGDPGATEFRSLNPPYFVATVKGGSIDGYE